MVLTSISELRAVGRIAVQFGHLPTDEAATVVADHLTRFWDRRMITRLIRTLDDDPTGVDPIVAGAANALRERAARARGDTTREDTP